MEFLAGPGGGAVAFGLVILTSLMGMPIAFSAAIIGIGGIMVVRGMGPALSFAGVIPFEAASSYTLSVLPLFILMGYMVSETGATTEFYYAARQWLGRLPGGLAMATIAGAAAFAACTGSSAATAALFGTIAYPEMIKQGYSRALALGSVCCSAPLAVMIPPSALLVIYAIMAQTSISKQLMAGFLPGILTTICYMVMILVRVKRTSALAPSIAGVTWKERIRPTKGISATLAVIVVILGGLYSGIVTPTEAGGLGCFAGFMIGVVRKRMSWQILKRTLLAAAKTNCMIFSIIVGIFLLLRLLAITTLPYALGEWIIGLHVPPMAIIAAIMVLGLILGCFMDGLGILMLIVPIVYPTVIKLGFDPIWFGVLMVHNVEMGLVTPPVGLAAFALKGVVPDVPLEEIFRSITPFLIMMLITLAVLMAFPQIALILPRMMS